MRAAAIAVSALAAGCATFRHKTDGASLRVMSYNIRSGNGDLEGIAAVIRAAAPDLVALQEVDVHWAERSRFVDQAAMLGDRLGMTVRFAPIYHLPPLADSSPPREFGVALLSRHPISHWSNDSLTRLSTQEPNPTPRRMPGLLDVTVDVRGAPVRVLNTHLDYRADPAVRTAQVQEMLNELARSSLPTIVCGDLNAAPNASELAPLRQRLHDAWKDSAGAGLTYPADQPTKRIDYVLLTKHFRVRLTRVPETLASDHRPVITDVVLFRSADGR